ncbi:hypothetical protein [Gilvimarinus polysaccharolyticus]|uniref:hypothetical protein n=1 Tax=Gilvimarinus polysaccharolyticus TaxID=863921 RepID=UPI0006731C49|nr:hypothetical protein [Gilvimarinus polysaccharolyticus]
MNADARIERTLPRQTTQLDPSLALFAELIGLFQMHRGASLAALGGVESLHKHAASLYPQIDTLIAKISDQAIQTDPMQWTLITGEWENTRRYWRQDNALSNFEIHNFLIEQCHRMLWRYVESQASPSHKDIEEFLFRDIPSHIEGLGQLRGLSSYASTQSSEPTIVNSCNPRVTQLSKQAHLTLVETQRQLIKLAEREERTRLMPVLQARIRLTGQFLQCVQDQLTPRTKPIPQPEKIFHLGTLAIEANQEIWAGLAASRYKPFTQN